METVEAIIGSATAEANSSLVKEGSRSPQAGSGRNSPPPNCAICLGTCQNKSFTDSCLHQFCFTCLLTWSKVKAECPLCKQNFKSIIHNVRSNHQYEEYRIETTTLEDDTDALSDSQEYRDTRRFRYRTTLTLPRRDSLVIQRLLMRYPLFDMMLPGSASAAGTVPGAALPPGPPPQRSSRPPHARSFRRLVYRNNMWARPMPDFTGRFRASSPVFYRYDGPRRPTPTSFRENDASLHRLVPWLDRELAYLLNDNTQHVQYVIDVLLNNLRYMPIKSERMRAAMAPYLGERTEHFLHELYVFAASPYDLQGYDQHVNYTVSPPPPPPHDPNVNWVSSETDSDSDRDVLMVSCPRRKLRPLPALELDLHAPSTSGRHPVPPAVPPPGPSPRDSSVIPIETISHSDTEDSASEVVFTGYIKPPQDRTPEMVDLLASDSDVVCQEGSPAQAEPEPASQNAGAQHPGPLVKLILKRHRERADASEPDSDGSWFLPKSHAKRRARAVSYDSATTVDTRRSTPSPAPSGDSYRSLDRDQPSTSRPRAAKKKTKKSRKDKSGKRKSRDERKAKKSKSQSSERHKERKKKKGKSRGSRDAKSSRRTRSMQYSDSSDEEQSPGVSNASHKRRKVARSPHSNGSCRSDLSRHSRSFSSCSNRSRSSLRANTACEAAAMRSLRSYGSNSGSAPEAEQVPEVEHTLSTGGQGGTPPRLPDTDSEDNLPLNLAVQNFRA